MSGCGEREESLSEYERGELAGPAAGELEAHLAACAGCRRTLGGLRALSALAARSPAEPLPRRTGERILAEVLAGAGEEDEARAFPEVMTMEEVARFLRVGPDELEEELGSMPTFEFAGRLRMRRSKLVEWIEERERKALGRRLWSREESA